MDEEEHGHEQFDLIVVGAGPAGLFCAINACNEGRSVLLIEKKESPGRKLLVSGSGHCNITHDGDIRDFLDHYGDHGRFLRPALLGFNNLDLISFFENLGLAMTHGEGGKVFPETMRSKDVLDLLMGECRSRKVHLRSGEEAGSISRSEGEFNVACGNHIYRSGFLVIATGGCSYPATGSTGNGYRFARGMGHSIAEVGPALTPVYIEDYPFSELSGISFPGMEISLYRGRKIRDHQGDVLFTHTGLSGPGILDLSRHIRTGDVLKLSFVKGKGREEQERWLMRAAKEEGTRSLRSVLADHLLPTRLASRILEISCIHADLQPAHLTREMRTLLAANLTAFPMAVSGLGDFNTAMVTRGGVDLKEVNSKTMESRLVGGLYLAGEVLDVDGDTGGYNLQAAFSTGMLAARSIQKRWIDQGQQKQL
ncbi:MAG TPA: NAD(P)/FAD-dependent oxidoreductase [Methanotrichaceae archaeon]|nr:NAD(P)/FAD-dependent oxidoreductase [Methanotrichaceae archaeon]